MIKVKELNFASSIGVLYALKERYNHKTLQETYKMLESTDMDVLMEVLCVAYNKANGTELTVEKFADLLDSRGIGFVLVAEMYQQVIEEIMFSGLSAEEIAERKNQLMGLKKPS